MIVRVLQSRGLFWFGLLVSLFFLWIVARSVDAHALGVAFSVIEYWAIFVCAGAVSMGMVLRAIRWRVIAGDSPQHSRCFSQATNLGVLFNMIFPGRAGEIIRVLVLARRMPCSVPHALASGMIDRLVDMAILIVSAILIYMYIPVAAVLEKWLAILAGFFCLLVLLAAVFLRRADLWREWFFKWLRRFLGKWGLKPEIFLSELFREFRALAHGGLPAKLFAISIVIWCVDYAAIAAILISLHLALPVEAPLLLWVFLAAGAALPSAPGYLGVYQVAAIWALSFYAVPAPNAVATAIMLQVTTLAVALMMSVPAMIGFFARKTGKDCADQLDSPAVPVRGTD